MVHRWRKEKKLPIVTSEEEGVYGVFCPVAEMMMKGKSVKGMMGCSASRCLCSSDSDSRKFRKATKKQAKEFKDEMNEEYAKARYELEHDL